jgi:hypothetical protein
MAHAFHEPGKLDKLLGRPEPVDDAPRERAEFEDEWEYAGG